MTEEQKRSKWRYLWIIAIGLLILTGVLKVISEESMVNNMEEAGFGHMTFWLGILELSCVVVFLIPKTRNIGFLLCVAYGGGILAAEWIALKSIIPGLVVQVFLWAGMYFENPRFFALRS
ncbi:MAG: hypothetical protein ACFB0B_20825 [Thermonemataceae bacterium]